MAGTAGSGMYEAEGDEDEDEDGVGNEDGDAEMADDTGTGAEVGGASDDAATVDESNIVTSILVSSTIGADGMAMDVATSVSAICVSSFASSCLAISVPTPCSPFFALSPSTCVAAVAAALADFAVDPRIRRPATILLPAPCDINLRSASPTGDDIISA